LFVEENIKNGAGLLSAFTIVTARQAGLNRMEQDKMFCWCEALVVY
jgi:hypothetical protein